MTCLEYEPQERIPLLDEFPDYLSFRTYDWQTGRCLKEVTIPEYYKICTVKQIETELGTQEYYLLAWHFPDCPPGQHHHYADLKKQELVVYRLDFEHGALQELWRLTEEDVSKDTFSRIESGLLHRFSLTEDYLVVDVYDAIHYFRLK